MSELLDIASIYEGALTSFCGPHQTLTAEARTTLEQARDAARDANELLEESIRLFGTSADMIESSEKLERRITELKLAPPIDDEQWQKVLANEAQAQADYDAASDETKAMAGL